MDVDKLSWLKASEYRQNVLKSLKNNPRTPKDISEDTDYYLSHVSKTLSDLVDKELVVCITPEKRKGKLFKISNKGEEMIDLMR